LWSVSRSKRTSDERRATSGERRATSGERRAASDERRASLATEQKSTHPWWHRDQAASLPLPPLSTFMCLLLLRSTRNESFQRMFSVLTNLTSISWNHLDASDFRGGKVAGWSTAFEVGPQNGFKAKRVVTRTKKLREPTFLSFIARRAVTVPPFSNAIVIQRSRVVPHLRHLPDWGGAFAPEAASPAKQPTSLLPTFQVRGDRESRTGKLFLHCLTFFWPPQPPSPSVSRIALDFRTEDARTAPSTSLQLTGEHFDNMRVLTARSCGTDLLLTSFKSLFFLLLT